MKKIGILCPSDTELAPFLEQITFTGVTEKAMLKFYTGTACGLEITAGFSGVCKVNAAIAAQLFIDLFQVEGIVNAGVAGGIDPSVQLFDTIIAVRALYHDVAPDILTDFHPWLTENCFRADPRLLEAARAYSLTAKHPVLFGTMATGEPFIEDEKREEILQKFAPLCVDMETAGVAHVCHVNQVPFLSVRTITDTAAHKGIENFEKNCEIASARAAQVVMGILSQSIISDNTAPARSTADNTSRSHP